MCAKHIRVAVSMALSCSSSKYRSFKSIVNNCARNENLFGAYLLTDCVTSKTEHEPQRRRANRTPSLTTSTSDCAMLLRSRRTKRGGITRGRYLSMRVLSVVPRYAVTVGSLSGGTVIGKTSEERGSCICDIKAKNFFYN